MCTMYNNICSLPPPLSQKVRLIQYDRSSCMQQWIEVSQHIFTNCWLNKSHTHTVLYWGHSIYYSSRHTIDTSASHSLLPGLRIVCTLSATTIHYQDMISVHGCLCKWSVGHLPDPTEIWEHQSLAYHGHPKLDVCTPFVLMLMNCGWNNSVFVYRVPYNRM